MPRRLLIVLKSGGLNRTNSMMESSGKEKLTLVLLGRSGCGKGTQAKRVVERFGAGAYYMGTGALLRALIERGSSDNATLEIGRRIMNKGGLFPSWFAVYTWLRELIEYGHGSEHLVFDGAPRRLWEAKLLDEVMAWHERPLPVCIFVDVSSREASRRLLRRGRADDTPDAIKNRMAYFSRDVLPVIRYYRKHTRLIRVNGAVPPEEVWRRIDAALGKRFRNQWPVQ
ncbi:MAG: nucleoside monophosphate kinase [Candidatus Sungbacteria bacterium]|nr:nucleoside monophosphate kinase [Candidatus Sungbacteria bacterium]